MHIHYDFDISVDDVIDIFSRKCAKANAAECSRNWIKSVLS